MITRDNYFLEIESAFKSLSIVVLIGARQVGKTTIMQNYKYDNKTLKLNGQNPEVAKIFQKYSNILSYVKINLNYQLDGYLLIDEFQFISGISTMMKLLVDENTKLKIIVTGSSSLEILKNVEESLAGRVRVINVYSLSFSEFVKFKDKNTFSELNKYNINTPDVIANKQLKYYLIDFLTYGGMPRVALAQKENEKKKLLNDMYQTYLLKDVKAYVKNEDSVGFNTLLRLLAAQISNLVNINELSKLSGLSYKKAQEYIYLLEQMFIIKLVEPYSNNTKKTITKMKKVFFYDIGMRNIIYNSFNDIHIRTDNGAVFENFVYLEILKSMQATTIVNFYRTNDNAEIDFILNDMKTLMSIEVKFKDLDKPVHLKALQTFNKTEGVANSYVINKLLNTEANNVKYIQAYLIKHIFS